METFFEHYRALCKKHGETPNSVAKKLGASSGSVTAWKNGTLPRSATLQAIADHFCVTVDDLLRPGSSDSMDENRRELLTRISRMSPEDFALVDAFVQGLTAKK